MSFIISLVDRIVVVVAVVVGIVVDAACLFEGRISAASKILLRVVGEFDGDDE